MSERGERLYETKVSSFKVICLMRRGERDHKTHAMLIQGFLCQLSFFFSIYKVGTIKL